MSDKTASVGDRVEVLHRGVPTGVFGTVIEVRAGCLAVRGDGDIDDDYPIFDCADCFRLLEKKEG